MLHIAILGAGISGLATAWFLRQSFGKHVQLTIIEKNQRPGGWIETSRIEGFLFEQGPRSCRTKGMGYETLALIEALGLEDQVIVPHADAKSRYIYHEKKIQCLPNHLWEVPFHSLTKGWLKAFWRDWKMPKRQEEDESIHAFFSRRIGREWTDTFIDPFVLGIYAGDCHHLSMKSCFPLFDEWEQQRGSLLRGAWHHRPASMIKSPFMQKMVKYPLFSFQEGMESLPRALANRLQDCLLLGQSINGLKMEGEKIKITLSGGDDLIVDYVISTLPTFALGALLKDYSFLATKLSMLSYANVMSVNVGFRQAVLPYKGFGYLIPSRYCLSVLGCVWDSSVFPQHNRGDQTRLTFMMGGSHHSAMAQMSPLELMEYAQRILREHLGIKADPDVMQVKRGERAIPQFEVGYAKWKQEIEEEVRRLAPRLILSGSAWTGVAINECIAKARQLVQNMSQLIRN